MDCTKVGQMIFKLRCEKNMTQKALADQMNISDKTISKWERGLGMPDVSLLKELSNILGVSVEQILTGIMPTKETYGGNMKKIKFYVCPICGNVITATDQAEVVCCGRKLAALPVSELDEAHTANVELAENDYYITYNHEMSKEHYIAFVAYVSWDSVLLIMLYPEQNAAVRFAKSHGGKLYAYCTQHGLFVKNL